MPRKPEDLAHRDPQLWTGGVTTGEGRWICKKRSERRGISAGRSKLLTTHGFCDDATPGGQSPEALEVCSASRPWTIAPDVGWCCSIFRQPYEGPHELLLNQTLIEAALLPDANFPRPDFVW
jgi:hypothetical protein